MNLDTLISSDAVIYSNDIKSKKRALETLAEKLANAASKIDHNSPSDQTSDTKRADKKAAKKAGKKTGSDAVTTSEADEEDVDPLEIFQLLIEREKLGSTSMGHGVALPHARTSLTEHATAAFLKLNNGIDFDSPDNQKTDLIFALMVPEHYTDEHLKILSHLATLFSDEDFCQQLRNANSSQDIYNQLISWQPASKVS